MPIQSTKRGRPVKPREINGYGFHWFGRDDRGVSIWNGQPEAMLWGTRILGATSSILTIAAIVIAVSGGPAGVPLILAAIGALHGGLAWWMDRFRRRILSLSSAKELAANLQVSPEALNRAVEELGVRPKCVINGEYYFDPAELGEKAMLLRAAAAPSTPDALLRAVGHSVPESESLLLPMERPPAGETLEARQSDSP